MTPSPRLKERVAWISGGASGMGEAIAELFAEEGAKVAIIDVQAERGREVERRITGAGGRALFIPTDVADDAQVRDSIEQTARTFSALHIIVNCAGIVDVAPLHEYEPEQWDRLMAVNVKSIYLSMRHGIAHLKRSKRSFVVNIGSIGSYTGQGMTPAYNTSKHAVLGLSRCIALDYAADGLRCNCICPGITDTPLFRYHMSTAPDPEAAIAERLKRVPMGVALTPRDIAKAALYLSCDDSSGITGAMLVVDAGYTVPVEWQHPGRTAFMETP